MVVKTQLKDLSSSLNPDMYVEVKVTEHGIFIIPQGYKGFAYSDPVLVGLVNGKLQVTTPMKVLEFNDMLEK